VTHDQTEAMSMADRIVLMRGGRIEQNGTPAELYQRPESLFVARFIGGSSMNLLALEDGPGGAVLAGSDEPLHLPAHGRGRVLGLRPEDITLDGERPGQLHGRVTAVEYLGADALVTCMVGGSADCGAHQGRFRAAKRRCGQPPLGCERRTCIRRRGRTPCRDW
jgi:sn-glycerol 3-phosphate transport system ATP-binding protein